VTEQEDILKAPIGHLCVLACAGSGKTTVIVERISRLIETKQINPSTTWVITFTVLAAEELAFRFSQRLGTLSTRRPRTGTIHNFCLSLMKDFDPTYAANLAVLSEGKQFAILYRNFDAWQLGEIAPELTSRVAILELFIRSHDVARLEQVVARDIEESNPAFARACGLYRTWCKENNHVDFTDILASFRTRLRNGAFVDFLKEHLSHLVVDEYQDTDRIQEEILRSVAHFVPITVVGDDDQCIYQFRGTTVENILEFNSRFSGATKHSLSKNYRCRSNVVAAADGIVRTIRDRPEKLLVANDAGGTVSAKHFPDVRAEAEYIASTIAGAKRSGTLSSYASVALLFRSVASSSRQYVETLRSHGIPCVVRGDKGLFLEEEVLAVLAFLEVIAHPETGTEQVAMLLSGLGVTPSTELHKDFNLLELTESEWQMLGVSGVSRTVVEGVLRTRARYQEQRFSSFLDLYLVLLANTSLFAAENSELARRNLALISQIIGDYDEVAGGKNLRYLINYLKAYGARNFDTAQLQASEDGAVSVMTIHQSKGLEFEIVFCPMMVEKRFPQEERGNRLAFDSRAHDFSRYKTQLDQERRLYYVAITRARQALYVSAAADVGLKRTKRPSKFFQETAKYVATSEIVKSKGRKKSDTPIPTSYSKVEYYLACPYRYKLLFDLGLRTPANPFFEYGRLVHLILRLAHQSRLSGTPLSVDELVGAFEQNFPDISNVPKITVAQMRRRGERAIRRYLADKGNWLAGTVATELAFEFAIAPQDSTGVVRSMVVVGQVDLLTTVDGQLCLVDFKTGKPHEYIRTELQLQIYALAVQQQFGLVPIQARVFYVEAEKEITFRVTDDWLKAGERELLTAAEGIVRGQFDATPGEVCSRCEVRKMCEYRRST
jgi:DNA helicase II / ATP-dependent DNA helicase PcrA